MIVAIVSREEIVNEVNTSFRLSSRVSSHTRSPDAVHSQESPQEVDLDVVRDLTVRSLDFLDS